MSTSLRPTRRRATLVTLGMVVVLTVLLVTRAGPTAFADSTSYYPISGAGSTWSQNAIDQWIADVQQYGMRVNYAGTGSTAGRESFLDGTADFAASDIPFQTKPDDGSAPENPTAGTYAYMPITAGGTVFMYNLTIDGQRVTNLRLSGQNIAKIFTGQITNWDNAAIAADNPDLKLPDEPIVPVVRSDGAGDSFEFTQWMISQYPSIWSAYCSSSGRAPACGPTSFYPTVSGMIAQSGDLGVAGYVSAGYAAGAIGYVNYSYALNDHFPVAQMLNAAGYYTEPTPQNVAVSLLQAQINTDSSDPSVYLTENLQNVWTDTDPRTYPLSSYSYLILPITVQGQFNADKGKTLAAFSYYAMCQGQQQSAALGYSPMPINLVQASFTQIARIPGAVVQSINIQNCNNPTFTPSGANLLAQTAPQPPACDKQGPTQCTTATGGAQAPTPVSAPGKAAATTTATSAAARATATGAKTAAGAATAGVGAAAGSSSTSAPGAGAATTTTACSGQGAPCAGDSATDAGTTGTGGPGALTADPAQTSLFATPVEIPGEGGWSSTQTVGLLVLLALLLAILAPGIVTRWARRHGS
ncbi:MAG TPA: phosphate ABC transporter substrate-binding protein PstS [Acidimicrobiales bacterium]|nr:phosphate ABC transporter substrate-binding protein PstS [Acidimicrobiales bacterium]